MLALASLREVPEETANRMMMVHGSKALLRAIQGEPYIPEPTPELRLLPRSPKPYAPVAERPQLPVPQVIQRIINTVAEAFNVDPDELQGRGRAQMLVMARAVVIRLIRDRTCAKGQPKHSTLSIGRYMRRDHSTVCHALDHFDIYCEHWPEIAEIYERLRERGE